MLMDWAKQKKKKHLKCDKSHKINSFWLIHFPKFQSSTIFIAYTKPERNEVNNPSMLIIHHIPW